MLRSKKGNYTLLFKVYITFNLIVAYSSSSNHFISGKCQYMIDLCTVVYKKGRWWGVTGALPTRELAKPASPWQKSSIRTCSCNCLCLTLNTPGGGG